MLDIILNWKPAPNTLTKLIALSNQQQKSLETLLDEAVLQYFQLHDRALLDVDEDPIVGLYTGSPNLSTDAEHILAAEVQPQSGWTVKHDDHS
ncbi:MAG: hypothetical protein AAF716_23340 [Cyanobacteria bacterium P01_D01_bin.1]